MGDCKWATRQVQERPGRSGAMHRSRGRVSRRVEGWCHLLLLISERTRTNEISFGFMDKEVFGDICNGTLCGVIGEVDKLQWTDK